MGPFGQRQGTDRAGGTTHSDGQAPLELREDRFEARFFRVGAREDGADLLPDPVLHVRPRGQQAHHEREGVRRGVVAREVEQEDVAVDFFLGHAFLAGPWGSVLLACVRLRGAHEGGHEVHALGLAACDRLLLGLVRLCHVVLKGQRGLVELLEAARQPRLGEVLLSQNEQRETAVEDQS